MGGGDLIAASASGGMLPPSIDEGALTAVLPIGRPCDPPSDGQHPFTTIAPAGGAASPSKFGPIAPAPPEPERSAIQDSARQMPAPARLRSRDTAGTQKEQKRSKPLNLWRTRRDSNSRPLPSGSRGFSQPPSKWGASYGETRKCRFATLLAFPAGQEEMTSNDRLELR